MSESNKVDSLEVKVKSKQPPPLRTGIASSKTMEDPVKMKARKIESLKQMAKAKHESYLIFSDYVIDENFELANYFLNNPFYLPTKIKVVQEIQQFNKNLGTNLIAKLNLAPLGTNNQDTSNNVDDMENELNDIMGVNTQRTEKKTARKSEIENSTHALINSDSGETIA